MLDHTEKHHAIVVFYGVDPLITTDTAVGFKTPPRNILKFDKGEHLLS